MRPSIVSSLNAMLGTPIFEWLVPTPTTMYVVAALCVSWVFISRSPHCSRRDAALIAAFTIAGALLGSRAWFLIQHLLLGMPVRISLIGDGSASWGSYVGGVAGLAFACRVRTLAIAPWLDLAATCMGAAVALGRVACFLNGDDYGQVTSSVIGVRYPPDSFPYQAHVGAGLIPMSAPASLPVHPVQLYLSTLGLSLFAILSWIRLGLARWPGATFALYWVLYCPGRFCLEFFRGDQVRPVWGLSVPQLLSAALFIPACWAFLHITRRRVGD